jgi:uncharacterized protein with von Willebrand factor type A (vWA) domain
MHAAQSSVLGFIETLRDAGLYIDTSRVGLLLEATSAVGDGGLYALYLCGRTTLCASPGDIARYDACFARFFFGHDTPMVEILPDPEATPMIPGTAGFMKRTPVEEDDDREIEMGAASAAEILRTRKLSALSAEERELILALITQLRGKVAMQRGRRRKSSSRGPVDVRRTVKAAYARGGEPDRLFMSLPRPRPRKRVLLLDISGSMAPFAPGLLRFGYAAFLCARRRTEVFTMGTRLTRITKYLDTRDSEAAIVAASRAVPDWSGGTRLGDQLGAFLDIWGQRGMARGAIVVIASDGWERGGATMLASQMRRLQALSHRIIWANPHKSSPGFEPLTQGMQAALPAIDDFVAGSSAAELAKLIGLMGEDFGRRRTRELNNSTIR